MMRPSSIAVQRAVANVEREPGLGAREAARLDDLGQKVGADLDDDLAQELAGSTASPSD